MAAIACLRRLRRLRRIPAPPSQPGEKGRTPALPLPHSSKTSLSGPPAACSASTQHCRALPHRHSAHICQQQADMGHPSFMVRDRGHPECQNGTTRVIHEACSRHSWINLVSDASRVPIWHNTRLNFRSSCPSALTFSESLRPVHRTFLRVHSYSEEEQI